MIRNLKALGIALFAVFALGATMASAASASLKIFDSTRANTVLTGTSDTGEGGNQVFIRSGVEIKCTHAEFEGTATGTETSPGSGVFSTATIQLFAAYTTPTCSGPLGSEVHVDFTTNHCKYDFTGTVSKTATAELQCDAGSAGALITPTVFGSSLCTITVKPQATGGHVVIDNITDTGHKAITATATASAITSTRTGSSACGPEHNATATYTGNATLTGYVDEGDTTPPFSHGAQIDIEAT